MEALIFLEELDFNRALGCAVGLVFWEMGATGFLWIWEGDYCCVSETSLG